jgi:hypothetical protein
MRKLAVAIAIVGALASSTVPADAQYHNRNHGGGGHHRGGGGGWVAPLVGGMLLGGAIYGLSQPTYAAPGVFINPQFREPRPQYRRECQYVPAFDVYGNYYGERLECFNVPNY